MCLINSLAIFCLIQMIMLSSLSDLLRFIDENQLNTEFGGNLEQCHSDWIVLRTVSFLISRKEYCNKKCSQNGIKWQNRIVCVII